MKALNPIPTKEDSIYIIGLLGRLEYYSINEKATTVSILIVANILRILSYAGILFFLSCSSI
jgi:hypothetical protein